MKLRYKETGDEVETSSFNLHALTEVDTHDDSVYFWELDAFIVALNKWKDLQEAFRDRDIITDNYNTIFFEPTSQEDRERGFTL